MQLKVEKKIPFYGLNDYLNDCSLSLSKGLLYYSYKIYFIVIIGKEQQKQQQQQKAKRKLIKLV